LHFAKEAQAQEQYMFIMFCSLQKENNTVLLVFPHHNDKQHAHMTTAMLLHHDTVCHCGGDLFGQ
jgi:5-methylcytosine-specific restriction endonuclease McrBC regulatory subunit McrC